MDDADTVLANETEKFRTLYTWLKSSFHQDFFKQVNEDELRLMAHNLMGFKLQEYFSTIHFATSSIVLSRDLPGSAYKIYQLLESRYIVSMRTFVSDKPLVDEEYSIRITLVSYESRELYLTEQALTFAQSAQNSDYTLVEIIRSPKGLKLQLALRQAPRTVYVGRLFKALIFNNLKLANLRLAFINAESPERILYLETELVSTDSKACWEHVDAQELIQELVSVRDFAVADIFEETFVREVYGDRSMLIFLRACSTFIQQLLFHVDPHMYSLENVQEAFCYWPDIAKNLYSLFSLKCDPYQKNNEYFSPLRKKLMELIERQDTGKESNDLRRKTILRYSVLFVDAILKTNFFVTKKGAASFRLDPSILQELSNIFPHAPFGIFYLYSRDFFGFHIRFQDLARGGLRTIAMPSYEAACEEAPSSFFECYQLAWTQERKNKDIPEGGSKAICFLYPSVDRLLHLYRSQRLFIESLVQLVNNLDNSIVDYYGLPEYLYLGPDENMHDSMIEWIAHYAKKVGYPPGVAFITSKPKIGINHKQYGVTSLGLNVCMQEVLRYLGIDPQRECFTVKMTGGPDGDVAGNQIINLEQQFSKTAKLLTIIDISGVIYDPEGLDLALLKELFIQKKPIRFFPPEKLSEGGFLLDITTERKEAVHIWKTLSRRKRGGQVFEEWLSASDAQEIWRTFVHKTPADIFIPAGGRPATLNKANVDEFLDANHRPTAKAIIEGANLYLTQKARDFLEERGAIIIKDSSANKGGVICSSFEVLASLSLTDDEFLKHKEQIVAEILLKVEQYAQDEVRLILDEHLRTKEFCSHISERISERINAYASEIRGYLQPISLAEGPYLNCFFEYCLPFLTKNFQERLKSAIPEVHKKAVIASWIASRVVYLRGLSWQPTIVDILPFLVQDPHITSCPLHRK